MKRIFLGIALGLGFLTLQAQNDNDLLRYSQLNIEGSARFSAMRGAFGALGANFSALSTNPAAIGLYNRNEASFTLGLNGNTNRATYLDGRTREDGGLQFVVPEGGMVFNIWEGSQLKENGFRRVQFGIGVNRLNDYNQNIYIEGFNNQNSLMTAWANNANGTAPDRLSPFYEQLAYDVYLLDDEGKNPWSYGSLLKRGGINQKKIILSQGSTSEMVFTFGGNFSDKLYMGATIGVPFISYRQTSRYSETNTDNRTFLRPDGNGGTMNSNFQDYTFREDLYTFGTGINLKVGLIYRPLDILRIGLSVHTPTYYSMRDEYKSTITNNMTFPSNAGEAPHTISASGSYRYKMVTPWRGILSMGFIVGKIGSIAVEGEFVNYRSMRYKGTDDYLYEVNEIVGDKYKPTGNIRIGTEWKAGPMSFRGGYGIEGNPYASSVPMGEKGFIYKQSYSLGLGVGAGAWTFDLAFTQQFMDRDYIMYNLPENSPMAKIETSKYLINLSVGFKF